MHEDAKKVLDAGVAAVSRQQDRVAELAAKLAQTQATLAKINDIRNSIVGLQTINWSEHIYPLVAALNAAGIVGMPYPEALKNFGTMLERTLAAEANAERYLELRNHHVQTEYADGWVNFHWHNVPMHGGGNLEATLELHRCSFDAAVDTARGERPHG